MSEEISTLLSDVTIKGDIVEKEKLVTDSKIEGDITADQLQTHEGAKITGNISSSKVTLGFHLSSFFALLKSAFIK